MLNWARNHKDQVVLFAACFMLAGFFFARFMDLPQARADTPQARADTPQASGTGLDVFSEQFEKVAEEQQAIVVNISTSKMVRGFAGELPFDFFRFFGDPFDSPFSSPYGNPHRNMPMPKEEMKETSLGSGVIIDQEGYVLTNNHLVEGTVDIKVTLLDGESYTGQLVGSDDKLDIALVKIDPKEPLKCARLGDSDKLRVGQWVLAIGNPFGIGHTVTAGVVSGKGRELGGQYDDFIQTDASINPGNSGGPMLTLQGEVVGINTVIFTRTGGSVGIGFAIPINKVREVLPQIREHGKVIRGWIGVRIQPVSEEIASFMGLASTKGALVADVEAGSPAEKAGIEKEDVLVSFDGQPVDSPSDLSWKAATTPVGKKVPIELYRNGEMKTVKVTIGQAQEETSPAKATEEAGDTGLEIRELTLDLARRYDLPQEKGLIVWNVRSGSPAEEGGLRRGDVIVEVNRKPTANMEQYAEAMKDTRIHERGRTALFYVRRDGVGLYLSVTIPR